MLTNKPHIFILLYVRLSQRFTQPLPHLKLECCLVIVYCAFSGVCGLDKTELRSCTLFLELARRRGEGEGGTEEGQEQEEGERKSLHYQLSSPVAGTAAVASATDGTGSHRATESNILHTPSWNHFS